VKVKLAELPEGTVWVVAPVGVSVKSGLVVGPVPMVMSCGAEVLGVKLGPPL